MAAGGFKLDFTKLKNIKLTKEQQQYVVGGVLLLGFGAYGYWNYLLKPLNARIEEQAKQLKEKKDNLEKARKLRDQWEEYTQRLARAQTAQQYVSRRLPSRAEYNVALQRVVKMTLEQDVMFIDYKEDTSAQVAKSEFPGFEKKVSILKLIASYHRLGAFLSSLSTEDLVYNVEDVKLLGWASRLPQEFLNVTSGIEMKLITYAPITEQKK